MTLQNPAAFHARHRATDPSLMVSWDAAGGVGLRLDKDEW